MLTMSKPGENLLSGTHNGFYDSEQLLPSKINGKYDRRGSI